MAVRKVPCGPTPPNLPAYRAAVVDYTGGPRRLTPDSIAWGRDRTPGPAHPCGTHSRPLTTPEADSATACDTWQQLGWTSSANCPRRNNPKGPPACRVTPRDSATRPQRARPLRTAQRRPLLTCPYLPPQVSLNSLPHGGRPRLA
ncbi:hypothetical protein GCM10020229_48250 [Kitasatospora albolonga]